MFPVKYVPLMVFQIILVVLFIIFVRHGKADRETNEAKGFEGTHIMIFIGFGYLMTFLKKYCYSALGFNWLLAAMVVQWALLCQNFFHMKDGLIMVTKYTLLEADIMSATVLITFGALLGVASGLQLLFIAIVEVAIACTNLYLVVDTFQASDAGGSIAIHTFGAYFGLGASLGLRLLKKKPADQQAPPAIKLDEPSYSSDITAMIGSIFLWIYWPSFNSALVSTPGEYERSVVNTYLSLASATVVSFVMSHLLTHEHKFDMVHVQNSTLAGGVAVGAICNMQLSPGGALAVGFGAGVLSVAGYRYLTPLLAKIGILDTCGVNNLHGMPGILSGVIAIGIAAVASKDSYGEELGKVFPAMVETTPRTAGTQALYQLIALAVTVGLSFVSGLVTGLIASMPVFKPLKEEERYDDEIEWEVPK